MTPTAPETPKQPKNVPVIPWNPFAALLVVIGLYFLAPTIGGLFVSLYPMLQGWDFNRSQDWLSSSIIAQFFYVLLAESLMIGGLVLFLKRYKKNLSVLGFKRPRLRDVGVGLLAYPVYFIGFAIVLVAATQLIPALDVNQEQQLGFDNVSGPLALTLTFISLVVLPPLVEEIMVRGFLFGSLRKHLNLGWAALVTSLAFAAAHLPEGGDTGPLYIAAIDTFILSLVLCYVREKTGSLWAGIVLHAIKNGIAFISLFVLAGR
ncbi:hypothetical protein BH09PAT3_BH09PAT3_6810 [soil metagenome]